MVRKQRQHFLPAFLLRRFAADGGPKPNHVWRLDKTTGEVVPRGPRTEAASRGYYDLPAGVVPDFAQPEKALMRIENDAAKAIERFETAPRTLRQRDVAALALFALVQYKRTPIGRREVRFFDELYAKEKAGMRLGVRERVSQAILASEPGLSEAELEARRLATIADLEAGRLVIESTAEREIAGMFLGIEVFAALVEHADFQLVNIPPPAQLVLPDVGITQYDPQPRIPDGGSGFLDTPTAESAMHVTPISALVITPGSGRVGVIHADYAYTNDLNYRAYASAERYVYGPSRDSVEVVHRLAQRYPDAVHERRRRPRYLWITEHTEGEPEPADDIYEFRGYSIEGEKTMSAHVDPRARIGRPLRAEDLWSDVES